MGRGTSARRVLSIVGPGLLVAATGVGAGDLATAGFTGSRLGTAVLWAVVAGAFVKFVLNEGLARWQLATGQTLLEGVVHRFGAWAGWIFLPYLLLWSLFVGSAVMSACGVTLHALLPVFDSPEAGKVTFGLLSSAVGLLLAWKGGFPVVERVMSACVLVMFATVLVTVGAVWPGTGALVRGLLLPTIPDMGGEGLDWTVALMGGIGGTLTVLCYGYWIREEKRSDAESLTVCRLDLGVGYAVTAVFGLSMVVIGSTLELDSGGGAGLLVALAERLEQSLGSAGRTLFLVGAAGAVLSSLLGVWQAVPYLFADLWGMLLRRQSGVEPTVDTRALPYRGYLLALATIPATGLFMEFERVQKVYAIVGAAFMPLLALVLLILNGRARWVGPAMRNRPATVGVLLLTLAFFAWIGSWKWAG